MSPRYSEQEELGKSLATCHTRLHVDNVIGAVSYVVTCGSLKQHKLRVQLILGLWNYLPERNVLFTCEERMPF